MSDAKQNKVLDTSGLCCPMPIVHTNKAIRSIESGELLEIVATDPGTENDIPSWCERTGHQLLESRVENGHYTYLIKKQG